MEESSLTPFNAGCLQIIAILVVVVGGMSILIGGLALENPDGVTFGVVVGLIGAVMWFIGRSAGESATKDLQKKLQWLNQVPDRIAIIHNFGALVSGFPICAAGEVWTGVLVTTDSFILYANTEEHDFKQIGAMRRTALKNTEISDHSQITKRIEMGALIVFGPLGLGAQKTEHHDKFYFIIDWEDNVGQVQRLLVRNKSIDSFNLFSEHILSFEHKLTGNEKTCPFCAEVIKAQAMKCRFCGSDLVQK